MKKLLLLIILALSAQTIKAQADAFITTWVTTTGFETLTLPAQAGALNYTINWGDGHTNTYTATQAPSHTYVSSGEYTVSFTGTFPRLTFGVLSNPNTKLKAVQQWGTQKWTSMSNMFQACRTINSFPTEAPDLSLCTDMSGMFLGAYAFNQPIGHWNVGKVTNLYGMFAGATAFNQPMGAWNVSSVTNMYSMFDGADTFNQPIGSWNVSKVTDMQSMFNGADAFNQTLDSWNVSKVTKMGSMFSSATSFNQPIGAWNVSKVTDMFAMFHNAEAFNQPIGFWDVSQVTNMSWMFLNTKFNQPLDAWNVSKVTNMSKMFAASNFNQPIGSWNVSNVTDMAEMFLFTKLSTANYDETLIGWATRAATGGVLNRSVTFSGDTTYCKSVDARNYLKNTFRWFITDGGLNCSSLGTETFDKSSVTLYPNPTLGLLNLEANDNLANKTYAIFDALGKVVFKGKLNEGDTSINVEHLSKGIYYIKVATNKASKFIKE